MKIITGGISNKTRVLTVFTVFALLASALTLGTAAYQKGKNGAAAKGESYIYEALDATSGEVGGVQDAAETGRGVLVLGKDYDSNRTDAVICVYFNYKTGAVSTLQIPRDTYVKDGDYAGRINSLLPRYRTIAANSGEKDPLAAGIGLLMDKIEADFGVRLDNYVFLDSAAIEALTDAVGGVSVDVPARIDYTDKDRGIDLHLNEGLQRLNGKQAAQFVRYRQGYPQADVGRINAQKLYAAAMMEKIMSFSTAASAASIVNALSSYIKTDLDAEDIALLATKLCLAKKDDVVMYTLPGDGVTVGSGSYYGTFCDKLEELLAKGFAPVSAGSLKAEDFSHLGGGYTDTDGVKLSSVLEQGIDIPVFSDKT